MTGVLAHLRAEARPRWTACFGVVLLLGSTAFAGVVIAANVLAVGPGVVAAPTRPATMLRAE